MSMHGGYEEVGRDGRTEGTTNSNQPPRPATIPDAKQTCGKQTATFWKTNLQTKSEVKANTAFTNNVNDTTD